MNTEKTETVFARSLQWVKSQQRAWVLAEFIKTPEELAQEGDSERYCSMAALPLRSRDRDTSRGCLIVTANQLDALSEEKMDNLVLDTAAVSISTLLELYGEDNDAIIQARYGETTDDK